MELVPRISPRPVDGRAFVDGDGGRLQGRRLRRRSPAAPFPDADDGGGNDSAGTRLCDRRRRRGTAGHCHGAPPGRGRRGLRRARRRRRAGALAGREVSRCGPGRHQHRRRRRLRRRADRRSARSRPRPDHQDRGAFRRDRHHRAGARASRAAADSPRRGGSHAARLGAGGSGCSRRRQLRADPARSDAE